MADAALAALEQSNSLAALGAVALAQPNGEVGRFGGFAFVASGLPVRLFNQIQVVTADAGPSDLARAVGHLRDRGDRLRLDLREGLDDRLVQSAVELGLVPEGDAAFPGMALEPIQATDPPPGDLRIHRVEDGAGLADFHAVSATETGMPAAAMARIIGPSMLEDPAAAIYVGAVEGRPVAIALGYRTDTTIGVYNVAVLDTDRRRGHGGAITRRVVADGAAAGATRATLQSSAVGESVYRAIGFRTVVMYRSYVDPLQARPELPG